MKFVISTILSVAVLATASPTGKIWNGQTATQSQFSYMASVKNSNGSLICGGAIIHACWVITAAHCNQPSIYWVGVGNLNINQQTNYVVQFTVPYPSYFNETRLGDILLIKTKTSILLSSGTVSSISLNSNSFSDLQQLSSFTIAGWGLSNAPDPNVLMYAPYATQDQSYCWQKSNQGNVLLPYSPEVNMCAVGSQSTPIYPVTICTGDSGGPLVYNNLLYGVASRLMSPTCPGAVNYPDVFSRVSYYYSWIHGIINGNVGTAA